jgi:hypothetical protein
MKTPAQPVLLAFTVLASVLRCGRGGGQNADTRTGTGDAPSTQGSASVSGTSRLPLRVEKDGWAVTDECILNLDREPYVRETANGRFLFAASVTIIPKTERLGRFAIHSTEDGANTEGSANDAMKSLFAQPSGNPFGQTGSKPVVQLYAERVPLKKSMGFQTADRLIIAGGEEGNLFGGEVTTDTLKAGTVIMPLQNARVLDCKGTTVYPAK